MKIEKIFQQEKGQSINISANVVESLRANNMTYNTVRVYDNGVIGIAAELGKSDWEKLEEKAKANLSLQVPYPETHEKAAAKKVDKAKTIIPKEKFVDIIKELVAKLAKENPEFIFSNKVNLEEYSQKYQSSDNVNYEQSVSEISLGVLGKYRPSANIFDVVVEGSADYYDEKQILHDAKLICDNFLYKADYELKDEELCIVELGMLSYFVKDLFAEYYCTNASIFKGKLNDKIFSEKFSLLINRNPDEQRVQFFDAEGLVAENYKRYLIKNGVFTRIIGTKKTAAQFGVDCAGCAVASYDSAPTAAARGIDVEVTADCIEDILKGQKALFIAQTSGGDMTQSGDVAQPVQLAYLYENGELKGKVDEFTLCGSIFDLLGGNYLGATKKGIFEFGDRLYLIVKAKVNK